VRPVNPLWYLAAFLVAIGSTVIGTAVAAGAWEPVREATVSPTTVRADAAGQSLAVFTDIVQTDRDVACRAIDRDKNSTPVPDAALEITVDEEGNQWHLIGLLPEGSDGLAVRCAPGDKRIDNASYGFATIDGFESRSTLGNGIGILGLAIAAAFGGYVFWSRRRQRKETTSEPA
jgi:hypothetical protein